MQQRENGAQMPDPYGGHQYIEANASYGMEEEEGEEEQQYDPEDDDEGLEQIEEREDLTNGS